MKRILLLILCLVISYLAYGQNNNDHKMLKEIEVSPPEFTGVMGAYDFTEREHTNPGSLNAYINAHIQYPERALNQRREGKAIVRFTVQPSGELTDISVINSIFPDIDDEVVRVLKTTEKMWRPGYNNKMPVAMEREVGIVFKLDNTRDFTVRASKFYSRGNTLLLVKHKARRALHHFEQGILLLPNEKCLLASRGIALYELGNKEGACRDWNRIKVLGGIEADGWLDRFCEMKGYAEMLEIVNE